MEINYIKLSVGGSFPRTRALIHIKLSAKCSWVVKSLMEAAGNHEDNASK